VEEEGGAAEEEAVAAEDAPAEECEEVKRIQEIQTPSRRMVDEHKLQNHSVYRSWCDVCVRARGLGQFHKQQKSTMIDREREGPRIFADFFFMNDDEKSEPHLALKFSRSGRIAATSLQNKGSTPLGVKFITRFVKETGVKRVVFHSDNEPALLSLRSAAIDALGTSVEVVPKTVPVGDHQANGSIESAVRELKRQMRAIRYQLEANRGSGVGGPLVAWMAQFAGDVISKYRLGPGGKTSWELEGK